MTVDFSYYAGILQSLWCVAFLLGIRHGFDADHIAAIDGMARFNIGERPGLARNAGVLFSLGHGAVVLCAALIVSSLAQAWQVPLALKAWGTWISALMLILLALLNLACVFQAPAGSRAQVAGWRTMAFSRLFAADKGWIIAGVGGLFALSFDTLSIASVLGLGAMGLGSWSAAAWLACIFVAGMLVTDGLNGMWIARLIGGAGPPALRGSRMMALTIAGVSIVTAGCSIGAAMFPDARWLISEAPTGFSIAIMLVVFSSFVAGRPLNR